MSEWERLDRFLRTAPRDVGCDALPVKLVETSGGLIYPCGFL